MYSEQTGSPDGSFAKAQRTVLRDQVAAAIRAAIASGRLRPGDRIVESSIAAQMDVSKAPVREALRLLENEGLATTVPMRGSIVTRLTPQDIEEIFEVRAAIERMAVGLLTGRADPTAMAELRDAVDAIGQAEQRLNFDEMSEADSRFHELLTRHSGNARLARLWSSMNGLLKMLVQLKMRATETDDSGRRVVELWAQHRAILDAIERGDRAGAQSMVEQHCLTGGRRLARHAALEIGNPEGNGALLEVALRQSEYHRGGSRR